MAKNCSVLAKLLLQLDATKFPGIGVKIKDGNLKTKRRRLLNSFFTFNQTKLFSLRMLLASRVVHRKLGPDQRQLPLRCKFCLSATFSRRFSTNNLLKCATISLFRCSQNAAQIFTVFADNFPPSRRSFVSRKCV